jgi:DUF4097 and DUF4098 domain-containing protein YvlB
MRTLLPVVIALASIAGSAAAQQNINETRSVRAGGTVEIVNIAGNVRVTTWDRGEVQVTGTLGRGVERLDFTTEGDRTRIEVVYPRQSRNVQGSNLEIRMPAQSSPVVQTVSAGIEITGVRGAPVQASSVSGSVEVTADRVPTLKASTVSGGVRLRGSSGSVDAESVSGSLDIAVATSQTRAKTASGSLRLRELSGSVEASTVSGEAQIEGGRFNRMTVNSVSGGVRFRGDLERGGLYHLNSHSGNVELSLPARVAADFEVNTFSGNISNEFGPDGERTSRYAPGRELRFTAGGGGARVVAKTFSGNVRLTRQ